MSIDDDSRTDAVGKDMGSDRLMRSRPQDGSPQHMAIPFMQGSGSRSSEDLKRFDNVNTEDTFGDLRLQVHAYFARAESAFHKRMIARVTPFTGVLCNMTSLEKKTIS